jgi:hypothetical protein
LVIDQGVEAADDAAMTKRLVISALWFLAIWGIGGVLHVFFDVPRALMLVPAIAIAAAWWIGLARYEARVADRGTAPVDRVRLPVGRPALEG